jgi:hypothetical protein
MAVGRISPSRSEAPSKLGRRLPAASAWRHLDELIFEIIKAASLHGAAPALPALLGEPVVGG